MPKSALRFLAAFIFLGQVFTINGLPGAETKADNDDSSEHLNPSLNSSPRG